MTERKTAFQIKNEIEETRSYIASDWPGIEERKHLYMKLAHLEKMLKEINEKANDQQEKN